MPPTQARYWTTTDRSRPSWWRRWSIVSWDTPRVDPRRVTSGSPGITRSTAKTMIEVAISMPSVTATRVIRKERTSRRGREARLFEVRRAAGVDPQPSHLLAVRGDDRRLHRDVDRHVLVDELLRLGPLGLALGLVADRQRPVIGRLELLGVPVALAAAGQQERQLQRRVGVVGLEVRDDQARELLAGRVELVGPRRQVAVHDLHRHADLLQALLQDLGARVPLRVLVRHAPPGELLDAGGLEQLLGLAGVVGVVGQLAAEPRIVLGQRRVGLGDVALAVVGGLEDRVAVDR